ncbi:MAG: oxygenase, partial [Proteobacteria bacterium]|nr:oxygenase [Pseudomonadota bacterium]
RHRGGLYLEAELAQLMGRHKNFNYVPCTSGDEPAAGYLPGRALDMALARHQDLGGWRVYLCGNPDMVNSAKRKTFFAGASLKDIHADPFGF